jgi:hypothetical protein
VELRRLPPSSIALAYTHVSRITYNIKHDTRTTTCTTCTDYTLHPRYHALHAQVPRITQVSRIKYHNIKYHAQVSRITCTLHARITIQVSQVSNTSAKYKHQNRHIYVSHARITHTISRITYTHHICTTYTYCMQVLNMRITYFNIYTHHIYDHMHGLHTRYYVFHIHTTHVPKTCTKTCTKTLIACKYWINVSHPRIK